MPTQPTTARPDRRKRRRFPLTTGLRYEVLRRDGAASIKGAGQVLDISSRGVAFVADGIVEKNQRLKISMEWPAKLDNEIILRLVFEGVVLRTRGQLIVLSIERPEFRTAGKTTSVPDDQLAPLLRGLEIQPFHRGDRIGTAC